MDHQKTLTISIPTWNRAALLHELLEQIIFQIEKYKLEQEIEIIVSDNCSTDETENIALKYSHKNCYVKYFKNSSNLGAKTNVIKSLILANGKFALLLGDDDRIRHDCLTEILTFLKSHPNTSILIDESKSKYHLSDCYSLTLDILVSKYYWYMGNAGIFITSTKYIKKYVDKFGFEFFNECWPQTQLMILGNLIEKGEIYIKNIHIPIQSKHDDVMVYTSFYLWRTCILELFNASHDLQNFIPYSTHSSCQVFMKSNIKQVFFNILQCGIFVDSPEERKKTNSHIKQHLHKFTSLERKYLSLITFIFCLPISISKPLSNFFIYLLKGRAGLNKKNAFVKSELNKRLLLINNNLSIRKLDFEK